MSDTSLPADSSSSTTPAGSTDESVGPGRSIPELIPGRSIPELIPSRSIPELVPIRVLRRRGIPKVPLAAVAMMMVIALVSFLAVAQLRGPDRFRQQLNTQSEGDLARILASLSSESTALQQEVGSLQLELANANNSSQQVGSSAVAAQAQLNALAVLSGTTAVNGPGLELVIEDPGNQVTYDTMVDAVQELRDAGAEALACNGRRIGVDSSFAEHGNRVTLDGVTLPNPYTLSAIGPQSTMQGGLTIPGGALDTLRALNGVTVDVHQVNVLTMPALDHPPTFHAAHPVGK